SPACDENHIFACSAGIGGRSSLHFDASLWPQLLKFDSNHDGKIQIDEVPDDFRFVQRPELPEGHPGRLLPFEVKGMLKSFDTDKSNGVTEEKWNKWVDSLEQSDVPVLMALRPGESVKTEERVSWKYGRGIPEVPSPLAYEGKLFLIRDGGLLQCMDASTGTVLYQERIGVPGGYAASPVAAQGRVFLASQSGTVTVINARSAQLDVLARNALE